MENARKDPVRWAKWQEGQRKFWLKRKYGLTIEDWEELFNSQGRSCAICNAKENGKRFAVDHCHKAGVVRGILCHPCNQRLGHIEIEGWLKAAKRYLDKHPALS